MLIPDAVRSTILARMRLLDRVDRRVIGCASAIGRSFDFAVLTAAAACSTVQARASLERARALELVDLEEPRTERYAFRHALIRDVIYGELITARTRLLHRRITRALETVIAPGAVSLDDLAYHAWAAGDIRRGTRYNELAGDRAAAVHAQDDAETYFNRARGLATIGSHAYVRLSEKLRRLCAAAAIEAP